MESSGHYWFAIASHLAGQGIPVAVISPVSAKFFATRRPQRATSDPADARTLAALAMVDRPRTREALVGVQHDPVILAHYLRKRAAGKSKINALGHCMKKALALVWGV
jgi:hypothetical protein